MRALEARLQRLEARVKPPLRIRTVWWRIRTNDDSPWLRRCYEGNELLVEDHEPPPSVVDKSDVVVERVIGRSDQLD